MKKLISLVVLSVVFCETSMGAVPISDRIVVQETARVVDYFIGTFASDGVEVKIEVPRGFGGGQGGSEFRNYGFSLKSPDSDFGSHVTVVGNVLKGEVQREGTTFRFQATVTKDELTVVCDGETFKFKRISPFPTNPFKSTGTAKTTGKA